MDPAAGGGGDGNSESDTSVDPSEPETPSPPTEGTASETATADEPATTEAADSTATTASESATTAIATAKQPFSWRKARRTLFPIHGKDEVHKFLLIGSIKFFIIMALTLTRDTKDTLIVTQCGAEAIAFLKVSSSSDCWNYRIFFLACLHFGPGACAACWVRCIIFCLQTLTI